MDGKEPSHSLPILNNETENELSFEYIEKSWERDKLLLHAVQTGDKDLLKGTVNLFPEEEKHHHYFANPVIKADILRTRKNGLIIRNTTCRIGAGLGEYLLVTFL